MVRSRGFLSNDPWISRFRIGSNSETGNPSILGKVENRFRASWIVEIILKEHTSEEITYRLQHLGVSDLCYGIYSVLSEFKILP